VAGKGGGAWKVAYADFVTAMMAFFLVMWICGQDQSVKRAVSFYFADPFGDSKVSDSKKSSRAGSLTEYLNSGSVPLSESVAMGRGRKGYASDRTPSPATKAVGDWLTGNQKVKQYWHEQAQKQRQQARHSQDPRHQSLTAQEIATRALGQQLREETLVGIPPQVTGMYQDLLYQALGDVNWNAIAEDLLSN
jgi:flagellar motor protein MotB